MALYKELTVKKQILPNSRKALALSLLAGGLALTSGCDNAGQGALTGAGAGALGGMAIGSLSGNMGKGAAIGAIAGGLGGAIIGDQNERNSHR
jgi:hypothetical protein